MRSLVLAGGAAAAAAAAVVLAAAHADPAPLPRANTPIQHVVVIFDENESFDHYFGTYPHATNPSGEPAFTAAAGTPAVDGLSGSLLTANPNGVNPQRIDRANALTCDMNHNYGPEQQAFDGGLMDKFPQFTAPGACSGPHGTNIVMDYFDGNTVTALWNYAQHFSMSDNSFGSGFGPSTPGAIELVSGQTHGLTDPAAGENSTLIGDPNPLDEDCGTGPAKLTGQNVGDLMNAAHVTWGWFQGGFKATSAPGVTPAQCGTAHNNIGGGSVVDYSAHHEPFQYYDSTANPHHLPPTSTAMIGQTDQANHQYDLTDFDAALNASNLPQVSFLKAAAFEDGHPGYSDPLDEQHFLVRTINAIEQSPYWSSTAIFIAYDDSDGWYDHKFAGIRNASSGTSDAFSGAGQCGVGVPAGGYQDRCGFGPRLPLLAISPYAKVNAVDHTLSEQASILKFIEDNWSLGRIGDSSFDAGAGSLDGLFDFSNGGSTPKLILDANTGNVPATTPPPVPTPTATPTPPVKPKPAAFKLKCTASGKGRRITVSCKASGTGATTVKTSIKLTVTRSGKTVVTKSSKLTKGKLKLTLKPRHTLKKGKYTLKLSITRAGKKSSLRVTFRVK
jgi:phospholipase C